MSALLERHSSGVSLALFETEFGWIGLAYDDRGLIRSLFGHDSASATRSAMKKILDGPPLNKLPKMRSKSFGGAVGDEKFEVEELIARLQAYAAGQPDNFADVPVLEFEPRSFRSRVLAACRRIPRGQTKTYGELADLAGSPGAARAVGSAMAANSFPLIIPCHRVIGSAGRLGGFSARGGLAIKRRLLELEGINGKWPDNEWANKSVWNKSTDSARIRPRRQKVRPLGARMK